MSKKIEFTKMHGAGNDYVYVDAFRFPLSNAEELSILWSDRHKGIGGDGLILICPSEKADFCMHMYNNDGSEGLMCGNGTRCIGKYVYEHGLTDKTEVTLETLSGIKVLHLHVNAANKVESVTVDMGEPILADTSLIATPDGTMREGTLDANGHEYHGTFVSMGNPHLVCFVDDAEKVDVAADGRALEISSLFPKRCNIEFASITSDGAIRMRVWERGTGITMACGTGACATAVAAFLTGRAPRKSTLELDGGTLHIEYREADGHIYMTGPAEEVFTGVIEVED